MLALGLLAACLLGSCASTKPTQTPRPIGESVLEIEMSVEQAMEALSVSSLGFGPISGQSSSGLCESELDKHYLYWLTITEVEDGHQYLSGWSAVPR